MTRYTPELGHCCFGCPTGECELPDFAEALFWHLWREIGRVYWNRTQTEFPDGGTDPGIPGIVIRPYWWGDEDAPEAASPNFAAKGVELRWYKYPGRGMSCNVECTPARWVSWFDACLSDIRGTEAGR